MSVRVTLDEPVDGRSLVDGQCLDGGDADERGAAEGGTATRWKS